MPAVQKQFQQQLLLSTYSPLLLQRVHLQKQNRFASEDGFYFTATFDTTPLTVRASYTVGTGWYHHGNLTPSRISAGRPLCLRLRLDGSIIVLFPCHCAAPRHRVLSADCIRSIPYSAVSVVINGHRGCLRASHSRLPAWGYPWLRLEENVQYRMDILFSKGAGIIFLMSSRRKSPIQPHEFSITENFSILYNISHFLYTKSRIGAIAWFRFCFSLYSFIYFFFAARSRLRTPCLLILSRTDISDVVYPSHNSITTSRSLPESRCVQCHNRESSI